MTNTTSNQADGTLQGLATSAPNPENGPEDSSIPESLLNQGGLSDWGSLCETLSERRQQSHVDKTRNAGEAVFDLSDSLFSPVSYSSLVIDEGDTMSPQNLSPALKRSL